MEEIKGDKISRILDIYTKLMDGRVIYKSEEALHHGVNERSIQRDIDDVRCYLENDASERGYINSVIYDREKKGYRLEQIYKIRLTNSEVLAICKILLDSRAFSKKEMKDILDRLVNCCAPKVNQDLVYDLIKNEEYHYVELRHKKAFIDVLWDAGMAIRACHYVEIKYERLKDKKNVNRKLKPVSIMFSEYYFYLIAFIDDEDEARQDFDVLNDAFPTIYRVDRIKKLKVLEERFEMPYSSRFEEGEFRKRVQFMYGGKLQKVRFRYTGPDVDAVLDRLPTAEIVDEDEEGYVLKAEVFGKGIDMWIRSQGDYITVLEGGTDR
ncbi:helix-turn-helix transcriptional regulator [Butyrivibrio sp. JL13D10]|uniref:helix-turn-helix transcriptional regulator n=1 Tax=Butyrivibrio sp. JL13D10 TaxID=3236815 RepID=UPI0038B61C83